jgi:ubiquinone/menaquinone biosynthesis C-methylase UbiE
MGNIDRFTGKASIYNHYRQRYPEHEILSRLQQWCGLQSTWIVADVGAGTGMLTEVFLSNGNIVRAIEPNQQMRMICSSLIPQWPQLEVVNATAEATTLPDHSIDIVAAGRAFHWFETHAALREFRRIIKPGGWLTLISLGRAKTEDAQSVAFEELLSKHGTDIHYVRAGYRVHDNLNEIFASDLFQAQLHAEQHMDWQTFLGQAMSFSMVPASNTHGFPPFQTALRQHFDEYAIGGVLTLMTTCWISVGRI